MSIQSNSGHASDVNDAIVSSDDESISSNPKNEDKMKSDTESRKNGALEQDGALTARCVIISCVSACGGLLFGYDTGVVSGVLLLLESEFGLTAFQQELFVSSAIAACVVGSLIAGLWTNDKFGRRPTLLLSAVFFAVGAGVLAIAPSYPVLLIGRLLVGIAVGAASLTSPMYIAETAPPRWRGALVTLNNLAITSGQLLAYALASAFVAGMEQSDSSVLSSSIQTTTVWRWLLGLSAAPAAILLIGMLFAPESPRWLISQGDSKHLDKAKVVLRSVLFSKNSDLSQQEQDSIIQLHVDRIVNAILVEKGTRTEIQETLPSREEEDDKDGGFVSDSAEDSNGGESQSLIQSNSDPTIGRNALMVFLLSLVSGCSCCCSKSGEHRKIRAARRALIIAVGVQMFQQLCGINTAMYYSATIIRNAGYSSTVAIWFSTAVAGANAFSTLISLFLVDHLGRRMLMCISLLGISVALVLLGLSFNLMDDLLISQQTGGLMAVISLVLYTLLFATGMGPVPWTIISEIFPMHLRAAGNGIATTANWLTNLLVSLTFLSLTELLSRAVVFWMFAVICILALIFVLFCVPETRRRSLEQIQDFLMR